MGRLEESATSAGFGAMRRRDRLASGPLKPHPAVFVFALVAGALAFHSSFPGLLGYDGFFHVAQAQRMRELGLAPEQTWMAHGAVADAWVDHHWGFHVLLMPLAGLGLLGGKLATAVLGGLSLGALYVWLRSRRVPSPELWALAPVALSWAFLFRLMMVRAMCLSTGLLVAVLHLAIRGPAWAVFLVSAAWALSYQMAILAVPIAIGAWAVPKLMRRPGPPAANALAGPAGFLAGLLVHPQSPHTLSFFVDHATIGAIAAAGTEWQPPVPNEFWMHGGALLLGVAAVALWAARRRARLDPETVLLLLGAAAASVLTLKSMRFVEFAAPLLAMSGGLLLRDLGGALKPRLGGLVTAVLAGGLLLNAATARQHRHPDPRRLEAAAAWLAEHVPPGTRVHNVQWDWWPEWVYYAPQYRYTVGFQPGLLTSEGDDKLEHFQKIRASWYEEAGPAIRGEFNAEWAVLGLPDPAAEGLLDDPSLGVVFRSPGAAVLRLRPKGDGA